MSSDNSPYLPATETPLCLAVGWEPKVTSFKKTLDWVISFPMILKEIRSLF